MKSIGWTLWFGIAVLYWVVLSRYLSAGNIDAVGTKGKNSSKALVKHRPIIGKWRFPELSTVAFLGSVLVLAVVVWFAVLLGILPAPDPATDPVALFHYP